MAHQSTIPQIVAIEPDETLYGLFDLSTGSVETASECDISDPVAEVLMANGPRNPLITHKYRGSQQFSRVKYSTQIY